MALVWSQANYAFPHTCQTEVNTAERTLVLVCAIHWMSFTRVLCMNAKEWRTIDSIAHDFTFHIRVK